jgi:hypothetical protein
MIPPLCSTQSKLPFNSPKLVNVRGYLYPVTLSKLLPVQHGLVPLARRDHVPLALRILLAPQIRRPRPPLDLHKRPVRLQDIAPRALNTQRQALRIPLREAADPHVLDATQGGEAFEPEHVHLGVCWRGRVGAIIAGVVATVAGGARDADVNVQGVEERFAARGARVQCERICKVRQACAVPLHGMVGARVEHDFNVYAAHVAE